MVDLPNLVQAAHGGEVVGNLAQQFGLSQEQAQAAIDSLTPAIAQGLQTHVQSEQGLGQVANHLNDPTHQQAYADPGAAQSPQTSEAGADLLGKIFGAEGIGQIVSHVSTETGVAIDTVHALASTLASIVAGGVAKALTETGFGDRLSQTSGQPKTEAPGRETIGVGYAVGDLINPLFDSLFTWLFPKKKAAPAPQAAPQAAPANPDLAGALGDLLKTSQASESLQSVLGQVLPKH
jgi:hypothetical protein